jgi:FkbM family methyltransferase
MSDRSFLTKVRDHIHLLAAWKAAAGLSAALRWKVLYLAVKLGFPGPVVWHVRLNQVAHPLQARLRGSSDMLVFEQIFIHQQYSCLRELKEPSLVLDLGANVGFSAVYFLSVFPRARVVAVEPDAGNVAICRGNLSPYGDRVLLLHGAAWSRPATLRLLKGTFRDGREWTYQVDELIEEERTFVGVQGWDVGSLIDMSGGQYVDLLKVDIERAELSVFSASASSWLHRVRNICIELHGKDCEEVFFAALKDFDYELEHSGELTICRNLRVKKTPPNNDRIPTKVPPST